MQHLSTGAAGVIAKSMIRDSDSYHSGQDRKSYEERFRVNAENIENWREIRREEKRKSEERKELRIAEEKAAKAGMAFEDYAQLEKMKV